jgi:ABC-type transporter Mla MlaB component
VIKDVVKIIVSHEDPESLRVELYGQLTSEYLSELEKALTADGTDSRRIKLDLSKVAFVDRAGMKFLCGAKSRNIASENIPSYVLRWIEQEGRCGSAHSDTSHN